MASHAETVGKGEYDQRQRRDVQEAHCNAKPDRRPARGSAPDRTVPEPLGQDHRRQDGQTDGDPQKKPAPVHRMFALLITPKLTMRHRLICVTRHRFVSKMNTLRERLPGAFSGSHPGRRCVRHYKRYNQILSGKS
jgi:hypothetical protein